MKNLFKSTDVKIYLSLLVYATSFLFVFSQDSYTHDLMCHADSSCFFMCGKAWMNGMIPYIDFADSKGPLLWLIYGIGYLISNYNYIGVFWLSCFSFSIALFLCYKIGLLLTGGRRKGCAVALLMALPYFFPRFASDLKGEDWCQPFIAASLYSFLKTALRPSDSSSRRMAGVVFGCAFMVTMLIKWSVGVMVLSFPVCALLLLVKRKQPIIAYSLWFIIAAAIVFIPFAVYMVATGSFGAFIQEYFLNTGRTVGEGGMFNFIWSYLHDAKNFLLSKWVVVLFFVAAVYLYYRKHRSITFFPLLCALFFLAIAIKHNFANHYLKTMLTFAIFLDVIVVEKLAHKWKLTVMRLCLICFLSMVLNFVFAQGAIGDRFFFFQDNGRKEYYDAAYLMSQRHNPTILYYSVDIGIGMPVNCLPATTYWTRQVGETHEMIHNRLESLMRHEPDFVIIDRWGEDIVRNVVAAGYQYYMDVPIPVYGTHAHIAIYGPRGLKMPPKNFKVSNMDILLKRKIKFANED